jgi:tetratricopeptide (TPR) repeat protein
LDAIQYGSEALELQLDLPLKSSMPGVMTANELEAKAFEHAERGHLETACDSLVAAIKIHPTALRYELLAQCLMELGRDQGALAEVKMANSLEPEVSAICDFYRSIGSLKGVSLTRPCGGKANALCPFKNMTRLYTLNVIRSFHVISTIVVPKWQIPDCVKLSNLFRYEMQK